MQQQNRKEITEKRAAIATRFGDSSTDSPELREMYSELLQLYRAPYAPRHSGIHIGDCDTNELNPEYLRLVCFAIGGDRVALAHVKVVHLHYDTDEVDFIITNCNTTIDEDGSDTKGFDDELATRIWEEFNRDEYKTLLRE